MNQEMIEALKTEINQVWFCEHIQDNYFLCTTLEDTYSKLEENFLPVGFCYNPDYKPEKGVAFVLENKKSQKRCWVHLSWLFFEKWLDDENLLDKIFPNGTRKYWESLS